MLKGSESSRTILISGAGIAGLATALFLARQNLRVELYEQAPSLDPIGSGIQLSPNAMQVLAQLGIDHVVKNAAIAPSTLSMRNLHNDSAIIDLNLGEPIVLQYGQPYLVIHRADLQQILLSACQQYPDIILHFGARLTDAVEHKNGVSAIVQKSGEVNNIRGQALIAADGVHSTLRTQCFSSTPARFTKTQALRTVCNRQLLTQYPEDQNIRAWLGKSLHIIAYPMRAERFINIVITHHKQDENRRKIMNHELEDLFEKLPNSLAGLNSPHNRWSAWPLYEVSGSTHWNRGNMLLIGDAAHAMTPHAAQGAAMALEDASTLGSLIQSNKNSAQNFDKIFDEFYKKRSPRIKRMIGLSRANRKIFQLPPPASMARNLSMKLMGSQRILARQDWVYRWRHD